MTDTDRQRLAAILGMLGSEHQGERDAAAIQAEAFRRKHGLTWAELIATTQWDAAAVQSVEAVMRAASARIAELEEEIQRMRPPPPPKPAPFVNAAPSVPTPDVTDGRWFYVMGMGLAIGVILILVRQFGFG